MEKKILFYSYWLGVLCVVIALLWRGANFAGFFLRNVVPGATFYYMSFYKAALLFLMTAIASAGLIAVTKPKE